SLRSDFCFIMLPRPQRSTLFPYTTLFRSKQSFYSVQFPNIASCLRYLDNKNEDVTLNMHKPALEYSKGTISIDFVKEALLDAKRDRKSTRLNSSHVKISYAVFCLKKKKK